MALSPWGRFLKDFVVLVPCWTVVFYSFKLCRFLWLYKYLLLFNESGILKGTMKAKYFEQAALRNLTAFAWGHSLLIQSGSTPSSQRFQLSWNNARMQKCFEGVMIESSPVAKKKAAFILSSSPFSYCWSNEVEENLSSRCRSGSVWLTWVDDAWVISREFFLRGLLHEKMNPLFFWYLL
jgi:hypothetical protein